MEPSEQVNRILAALGYGGGGYTVELGTLVVFHTDKAHIQPIHIRRESEELAPVMDFLRGRLRLRSTTLRMNAGWLREEIGKLQKGLPVGVIGNTATEEERNEAVRWRREDIDLTLREAEDLDKLYAEVLP
jgi:hypothetical protein